MPKSKPRHYRVTLADALSAHDRALRTGGSGGIRSLDLVLSSLGRPYVGYHRSIADKAAALMQAVAANHGFVDGNKRTSVLLTQLLLDKSGYVLRPVDEVENMDEAIEALVLAIVTERIPFGKIVSWFKRRLRKAN